MAMTSPTSITARAPLKVDRDNLLQRIDLIAGDLEACAERLRRPPDAERHEDAAAVVASRLAMLASLLADVVETLDLFELD